MVHIIIKKDDKNNAHYHDKEDLNMKNHLKIIRLKIHYCIHRGLPQMIEVIRWRDMIFGLEH